MLVEMLKHGFSKQLPFHTVLMDSWYASGQVMAVIDQLGKFTAHSSSTAAWMTLVWRNTSALTSWWAEAELSHGKLIKVRGFQRQKVKLSGLVSLPTERMSVATNDLSEDSTDVVQQCVASAGKLRSFTAN